MEAPSFIEASFLGWAGVRPKPLNSMRIAHHVNAFARQAGTGALYLLPE